MFNSSIGKLLIIILLQSNMLNQTAAELHVQSNRAKSEV